VQITQHLQRLGAGDRDALHVVIPLVYQELKKLARSHLRREARTGPLETTGLVHEFYLKLAGSRHPPYENRGHFYGIASKLMRQVLVDMARAMRAEKRGPGQEVALADVPDWRPQLNWHPLLAIDDALQQLEKADPFKAQLIEMRYFAGMTAEETSVTLITPVHIVRRELRLAQAWLRKEIAGNPSSAGILGEPGSLPIHNS
jgi:RNA polymerase sigma-70 factor (ECF subfamily)